LGVGHYPLAVENGNQLKPQVFHVDGLDANLFSISKFGQSGGNNVFSKHNCELRNADGSLIAKAQNKHGVFTLQGTGAEMGLKASESGVVVDINVLHKVYGHINCASLRKIVTDGMIVGIKAVTGSPMQCDACMKAKLTHTLLNAMSTRSKAKIPLERLSIDLFGPTRVASIHGVRDYTYAMMFSCYTRNCALSNSNYRDVTPLKLVFGEKPKYHSIGFGQEVYFRRNDPKLGKLDSKASIGYFVGFSDDRCMGLP
jgi:hypothetical protein